MQVQYTIEHADLKAFAQFCMPSPASAGSRRLNILGWLCLPLVVALAVIFVEELLAFDWHHLISGLLWVAGTLVFLLIFYSVWAGRQVRRHFDQPLTADFAADGLCQSDGTTRSVTPWTAVQRVGRSPRHLFFVFGHQKGVVIPTRGIEDPAAVERILARVGELRPDLSVEVIGPVSRQAKKTFWLLGFLALLLLLAATPWMLDPLRDEAVLPGDLGTASYRVTTTGGADPADPLPLVIYLHPLGGFPEIFGLVKRKWDFPARVVVPAGPEWHWIGYSWFDFDEDWDVFVGDVRRSADFVAAFTRLMAERYPTLGRPIVTGASQGGSVSYALAAYHPELFAAALPVSGAMAGDLPEREAPPDIRVEAFHGGEDKVVQVEWAEYTIEQMREGGWNVTFSVYPDVGHAIGGEAKDAWRGRLAELVAAQAGAATTSR